MIGLFVLLAGCFFPNWAKRYGLFLNFSNIFKVYKAMA
jgi:hypothetical protein